MSRTKLQKILAVYERFGADIAQIPDEWAQKLHSTSIGISSSVELILSGHDAPKPSHVSAGLEQGLRETPAIIAAVAAEWRPAVAKAFRDAISAEFPEFLDQDTRRMERVLARGKIKTESEFHLVRHLVDTLEADPSAAGRVEVLFSLLDAYESR